MTNFPTTTTTNTRTERKHQGYKNPQLYQVDRGSVFITHNTLVTRFEQRGNIGRGSTRERETQREKSSLTNLGCVDGNRSSGISVSSYSRHFHPARSTAANDRTGPPSHGSETSRRSGFLCGFFWVLQKFGQRNPRNGNLARFRVQEQSRCRAQDPLSLYQFRPFQLKRDSSARTGTLAGGASM